MGNAGVRAATRGHPRIMAAPSQGVAAMGLGHLSGARVRRRSQRLQK